MTCLRGGMAAAPWVRAGLQIGLATSLLIPAGIVVMTLIPGLWVAYPLLLLPLLLAGPLAADRLRLHAALGAAAVAGVISGAIAAGSFALAWQMSGNWFWALTSAASAPPMPPLPRITVLPTDHISWAHQDILFFQPLLAVALGLAAWSLGPVGRTLTLVVSRLLPRSLIGRLRFAFGTLIVLTLALGMIGFGMIEEMHMRTHQTQLRADWQRQLGLARATLDEELTLHLSGTGHTDPVAVAVRAERVQRVYQTLSAPTPRPGISAGRGDLASTLDQYRPALERAKAAHQAFRAAPTDDADAGAHLAEAIATLGELQRVVEADLTEILAGSDLAHHQRLIVVMILVGLIAGLGLWTGERVLQAIDLPLRRLRTHLRHVARGDFSRRVPAGGPDELRHLGKSVNQMTADLARLYGAERERRAVAEAIATREHELSAAKEFWTNTLVHDLKNPLTMIVGWTDLLDYGHHGTLKPDQHEALQQIRQAARMLQDLVADINDSFRLQAAALPIHRTSVRPGELLWTAVAEQHGLERATPDIWVASGLAPVSADVRLVGRVLHNLIGNAYKHGGTDARVSVVAEPAEGAVRFAVDDDGPGIPVGERERVFERFMQGAGAARGSGLGLAFCKLVVEQLDGRIWADTSPLGGTRIAFELPHAATGLHTQAGQVHSTQPAARVA